MKDLKKDIGLRYWDSKIYKPKAYNYYEIFNKLVIYISNYYSHWLRLMTVPMIQKVREKLWSV